MTDPYLPDPPRPGSIVDVATAINQANLTPDAVAQALGIDHAQVEQWANGTKTPNLRLRNQFSKLVEIPTRKLWPDHVDHAELSTQAEYDKLIGIPAETWAELLAQATHHIDMLGGGYGWWLEQNPQFNQLAREKTRDGLQIRICQADPNGDTVRQRDALEAQRTTLTPGNLIGGIETAASMWRHALQGLDNAELRGTEHAYEQFIIRFDDYLITSPYLMGMRGTLTYAELIHRDSHNRKFDHLVNGHFEPIWGASRSI